jgi:tight adherence protein B
MNITLMMFAVFASVTLGIIGVAALVYDYFLKDKSRMKSRIKEEFHSDIRQRVRQSPLFRNLQRMSENAESADKSLIIQFQTFIEQSGLQWNVKQVLPNMLILAFIAAALCGLLLGAWFSIIGFIVGAILLPLYIYNERSKRMWMLGKQLPEAFDVMGRAVRAGLSVPAAFQAVADDFPSPIAEEFAQCYEQQNLGISHEVALRELARRTGTVETKIFAIALIINRRLGGNLADLLGKLALTMRSRVRFAGRVRALTGEGRMQAAVLIALPSAALLALMVLNRSYVQVLLDKPYVLLTAATVQAFGAACIYKIINFKY